MFHHFFVENYIRIGLYHLISLHSNSMLSLVTDYQGRSLVFGPAIWDLPSYLSSLQSLAYRNNTCANFYYYYFYYYYYYYYYHYLLYISFVHCNVQLISEIHLPLLLPLSNVLREQHWIWLNKKFNSNYQKSLKKVRYRGNCFYSEPSLWPKNESKMLISSN